MLIAFGLFGLASASLALLVHELISAPNGYEDDAGFHIVEQTVSEFRLSLLETPRIDSSAEELVADDEPAPPVRRRPGKVMSRA